VYYLLSIKIMEEADAAYGIEALSSRVMANGQIQLKN